MHVIFRRFQILQMLVRYHYSMETLFLFISKHLQLVINLLQTISFSVTISRRRQKCYSYWYKYFTVMVSRLWLLLCCWCLVCLLSSVSNISILGHIVCTWMWPIATDWVAWSVCVLVMIVSHAQMAEPIEVAFGGQTSVVRRDHALHGVYFVITWHIWCIDLCCSSDATAYH